MDRKDLLGPSQIKQEYHVSQSALNRFLPKPSVHRRGKPLWDRAAVEAALNTPECRAHMEQVRQTMAQQEELAALNRAKKAANSAAASIKTTGRRASKAQAKRLRRQRAAALQAHLLQYDVSSMIRSARSMQRRFVIHCGATNSGKTYESLQALRKASSGCYLGPLRLLALEVFDTLNQDGVLCSLLTGEESIQVPFSGITASTIEMCDFSQQYDIAVIDEAQLLADSARGGHWLSAILRIQAREVHVCVAPEGLQLVQTLLSQTEEPYKVVYHERLTPLSFAGTMPANDYRGAQPGDAFIAFSRKAVLAIAAELNSLDIRASVIYGALPPPTRREEVRKFASGENTVVVATDAIGMGVSLPIRRIIFCQTNKYDGVSYRVLTPTEIKQIAGRAGRFGKYAEGYVLTMENPALIQHALETDPEPFTTATIPFPTAALNADFSLAELLDGWSKLPDVEGFRYEDMSEARILYRSLLSHLGDEASHYDESEFLRYITCPIDVGNPQVVGYWTDLTMAVLRQREHLPKPRLRFDTLADCELCYKLLDAQRHVLTRAGMPIDVTAQKAQIERRINALLLEENAFELRTCTKCGRPVHATARFNVCDRCLKLAKERARMLGQPEPYR